MKKITLVLLIGQLTTFTLFAQDKDSLAQELEMQRLRRMGDSMRQVLLARDSANREWLNEMARSIDRVKEEANQKQVEEATKQILKQREKEQNRSRKTMLLAISAFLVAVTAGGIIFKRKRNNNTPGTL